MGLLKSVKNGREEISWACPSVAKKAEPHTKVGLVSSLTLYITEDFSFLF